MPIKQIVRYCTVPSTAAAGVDVAATMGRTQQISAAISTSDVPRNSTVVLPTQTAAFFRSLPPTACPMDTVVPMASPTIITVSICIT